MANSERDAYLRECRALVLEFIRGMLPPDGRYRPILYDLVLEYPLRSAKALRPSLCIATCRALGGNLQEVLPSAAVLELYHNAFLIHDDVEDDSSMRRGADTLHAKYGVPIAVNVGDAMLALALQPLLENMRYVGMGRALRVLQAVATMARESAEGQAVELDWVRRGDWQHTDAEYAELVTKKSAWYTFITPMVIGGLLANASERVIELSVAFGSDLGVAFQIRDDLLNLVEGSGEYGKERAGDLWEGKQTLMLMHALRGATPAEREKASSILRKPRPPLWTEGRAGDPSTLTSIRRTLERLVASGSMERASARALVDELRGDRGGYKTSDEVEYLLALVERRGSIDHARQVAREYAERARTTHAELAASLVPSVHSRLVEGLLDYVVERDR